MKNNAIIAGATGLVGSYLLRQLLSDEAYDSVTVITRRPTGVQNPRLKEYVVDFDDASSWEPFVKGEVLFLCLGTTRARAGSTSQQYVVDHDYQVELAKAAVTNGVRTIVLVSSAGAKPNSPFFYTRMKAETERDIEATGIGSLKIIRPGPLTGPRKEKRKAEQAGIRFLNLVNRIGLFRKYSPVHAEVVAAAMIKAARLPDAKTEVFELLQVFRLAGHDPAAFSKRAE